MTNDELPPLTAEWFGEGPAREPHVSVVERWANCVHLDEAHPERELA